MNQNMNQIRARHVLAFANDPYVNVKNVTRVFVITDYSISD